MGTNRLSRFEERIRALVEGSFARLFAGRVQPREVALGLARAMEDGAQLDADGQLAAPNRYAVHLHPHDHSALLDAQPALPALLADHLIELAQESGFRLDALPAVELVPDQAIAPHEVVVLAQHVAPLRQATQVMERVKPRPSETAAQLPRAFLVVDGTRYIPLERTVINIGRRRDNWIVLDDGRVSRQHCQIRFRFGEFVLFDLGSRGGTFVNNQRVAECVLRPGDVISLAGVQMVYVVEDSTTGQAAPGGDTGAMLAQDRSPEDRAG